MKKLLTAAIITATLSGCVAVIDEREEVTVKNVESQNPKNIILANINILLISKLFLRICEIKLDHSKDF